MRCSGVTVEEVRAALGCGETIESHPEDRPYESCLVLGWVGGRPLHMVVADDEEEAMTIVVTVYRPSAGLMGRRFSQEEAMKGVICKQGETRPGTSSVILERDGATLVVRNVSAEVCQELETERSDED